MKRLWSGITKTGPKLVHCAWTKLQLQVRLSLALVLSADIPEHGYLQMRIQLVKEIPSLIGRFWHNERMHVRKCPESLDCQMSS